MTGLEKIIGQIEAEARQAADEALKAAKAQADELAAQAAAQAEAECRRIAERCERDKADALRRAESAADLQKRRALLTAKQAVIAQTLEKAHAQLLGLPAEEYFAAIVRLAAANAQPGQGVICLNEAALARLPAGFEKALAEALPAGCSLTLGKTPRAMDGGFILVYGGIEENCSFSALFASRKEALQDSVQKILFP